MGVFFQAEDGIRDAQESRGLGDVYKRQQLEMDGAEDADESKEMFGGDMPGEETPAAPAEAELEAVLEGKEEEGAAEGEEEEDDDEESDEEDLGSLRLVSTTKERQKMGAHKEYVRPGYEKPDKPATPRAAGAEGVEGDDAAAPGEEGAKAEAAPEPEEGTFAISTIKQVTIKSVFEIDIDHLDEKPWRESGAILTDYFNYEFNEDTWRLYCQHQLEKRQEQNLAKGIQTFENRTMVPPPPPKQHMPGVSPWMRPGGSMQHPVQVPPPPPPDEPFTAASFTVLAGGPTESPAPAEESQPSGTVKQEPDPAEPHESKPHLGSSMPWKHPTGPNNQDQLWQDSGAQGNQGKGDYSGKGGAPGTTWQNQPSPQGGGKGPPGNWNAGSGPPGSWSSPAGKGKGGDGPPGRWNSGKGQRGCLLYTSDAADEEDSVDLGGRRIIYKKKRTTQ
eukprot:TRINITY_DN17889_c0_g1_i1.p1 TRINITY_DN17889_c0_g1~~TRINITY_DN17889_c0_g1_i1.p1  ORF type:complete len:446 (-),score=122.82 TRINITY_DN17889_c0_g1_i1:25-1362(-)